MMTSTVDTYMNYLYQSIFFFFSSRRRHTRLQGDWSSDVCSSDLSYTETPDISSNVSFSHTHSCASGVASSTYSALSPIRCSCPQSVQVRMATPASSSVCSAKVRHPQSHLDEANRTAS